MIMKFRATVLGSLLVVFFCAADGEALILDYPHNVDNGIKCYHCHSADSEGNDYWWNGYGGSDPDGTVYNWICYERCHAGAASTTLNETHKGPEKVTHSKTTTGSDLASWTTQCIDCHDPHFQEQINWVLDGENIWVAQGTYTGLPTIDNLDIYDPDSGLTTGFGAPGIGTSTVGVTIPGYGSAIYNPTTEDWGKKGGKGNDPLTGLAWNERAGDHSRGLVLVADTNNITTSRTFEIISIVHDGLENFTMKVKGSLSGHAASGVPFGVIYGGLLADKVKTPETYVDGKGVTRNVRRPVKFYSPKTVVGGAGGPVDLDPAAVEEPTGMCQVCHTQTGWFNDTDTTGETFNHNADGSKTCDECHQVVTGGEPEVNHVDLVTPANGLIRDDNSCHLCHAGYDASPDTMHMGNLTNGGCRTCHTDPTLPTFGGAPNLRDPEVTQRTGTTNTGSTHAMSFDCTQCHNNTYGGVNYTTGHPSAAQNNNKNAAHNTAMAPQTLCVSCHIGLSDGDVIVSNSSVPGGHSDNCGLCHETVTADPDTGLVILTAGAVAAQTPTENECDVCHTSYFNGHEHGTLTGSPNHTSTVIKNTLTTPNTSNCTGCHVAPAGEGPFVGTGQVHSGTGCLTCHSAADGSPVGSAATGWPAGWNNPPASGECITCHTAHFDGHDHGVDNVVDLGNAEHSVSFVAGTDVTGGGTACYNCHADDPTTTKGVDALGDWDAIMIEHQTIGGVGGQNACDTCHNYTQNDNRSGDGTPGPGGVDTPEIATVDTVISSGSNVTCISCHVIKNTASHGSHLSTEFGWDATTKASCGGGGVAGVCHDWQNNQDVVLNVHGHIPAYLDDGKPCNKCHQNVLLNQYTRISGTDANAALATNRQAVCTVCHTGTLPFMHHENNSTYITYTPSTACATKCHNSTLGHPGDHTALVADVAPCLSCHTATKGSTDNVPVDGIGGNLVHNYCTDCHVVGAGNIIELITPPSPNNYVPTTMDPGTSATNDGGGPCSDCHTTYFDDHNHPHALTSVVNPCEGCHGATAAPFVATGGAHAANGCATCHDLDASPTGLIIVGSSAEGATGTEDCQGCHTGYFDNHIHSHTGISIAATCGTADCHDADGGYNAPSAGSAPYLGVGEVHDSTTGLMMTCGSCHDLAGNGGPKAGTSAANWGASWAAGSPGNCESCHNAGDFNTTHAGLTAELNDLHSTGNAGSPVVTENTGCMVCHDGVGSSAAKTAGNTTRPYIATGTPGQVHAANGCATCHQTSGAMISPAPALAPLLSATGGDCVGCHDAYFDSHTHHANPATNDFALDPLVDLSYASPGQTCGNSSGLSCHHDYSDNNGGQYPDMTDWITIQWEHDRNDGLKDGSGACITCHNGDQPIRASNIDPAFLDPNNTVRGVVKTHETVLGTGSGNEVHCLTCHADKVTPGVHGLDHIDHLLVNNTGQSTLGPPAWPPIIPDAECVTCHVVAANYADDTEDLAVNAPGDVIIDLHNKNCGACHVSQPELKTTPYNLSIFEQTDSVPGDPSPDGALCTECHQSGITISVAFHQMLSNDTQVIGRHDLLAGSSNPGTGSDCLACHAGDLATVTDKIDLHIGGSGTSCERCHTAADDAIPSGSAHTIIELGKSGADPGPPATSYCEDCHEATGSYLLHGMDDAGAAGIHDKIITSNSGTDTDCANCHDMTTPTNQKILDLHISTLNPDTSGGCLTCHDVDNVNLAASRGVVGAGQGTAGTNQGCVNCHDAGGGYKMHGVAFDAATAGVHEYLNNSINNGSGDQYDCDNCHNHASGSDLDQLNLHASLTNPCSACHTAAATGGAGGDAPTTISQGWNDTTPANAECEDCHFEKGDYTMHGLADDGGANDVTAEHNMMQNQSPSATSSCGAAGCHTTVAITTFLQRIQIHTQAADGTNTTCLVCHNYGGVVQTAITTGIGGGTVYCDSCHTAIGLDFYQHNVDHTGTGMQVIQGNTSTANETDKCTLCHTGDLITGVHDINTAGGTYSCAQCHNVNGTLVTPSSADNYTAGAPADECIDCHIGGFNGHSQRGTGSTGHIIDVNTNTDKTIPFPMGDWAQATSSESLCEDCHYDIAGAVNAGPNALDAWDEILGEHETVNGSGVNGCEACHNSTRTGVNTEDFSGASPTIQNVIYNDEIVDGYPDIQCLDCHYAKHSPFTHGGHNASQFPWQEPWISSCGVPACHNSGTNTNVVGQVHNGVCADCHSETPVGSGQDGNTGVGPKGIGTAEITDNGGPADPVNHSEGCGPCHSDIYTMGQMHHTGPDATGGNCIACHMPKVGTQGNPIATRGTIMMPTDLACNFCHLWWPNNKTYIADATDLGYNTDDPSAPGKVMVYSLVFDPNANQMQVAGSSTLASHAISTNSTTPINDYGACFACHGATGNGGTYNGRADEAGVADMVIPFHGLGLPITTANAGPLTVVLNSDFNHHVNNFYAGPIQNVSKAPEHTVAYNPGYGAFNWLNVEVGLNQGGGTKPYEGDDAGYKSIHNAERSIRSVALRNTDLGTTSADIEFNNWGADLAGIGSVTVNAGGAKAGAGGISKGTKMPLVPLAIPTSVKAR
jgi:hypothetical protein